MRQQSFYRLRWTDHINRNVVVHVFLIQVQDGLLADGIDAGVVEQVVKLGVLAEGLGDGGAKSGDGREGRGVTFQDVNVAGLGGESLEIVEFTFEGPHGGNDRVAGVERKLADELEAQAAVCASDGVSLACEHGRSRLNLNLCKNSLCGLYQVRIASNGALC